MGRAKALLPIGNQPALLRCLATLRQDSVRESIVVLGPETKATAALLDHMPVKIIFNTLPRSDMATSVRLGFQAMHPKSEGALVCLVDHPLVQAETVKLLVATAAEAPGRIIIPTYQDRRGHPTLFPRALLAKIQQGTNLREIIGRHPHKVMLLPVADEGVVLEMDTPEEYREICRRWKEEHHAK
jgi:CTP:molybdopterin cytidylyltransferase MocA